MSNIATAFAGINDNIRDGSLLIAAPLAMAGGLVSFLSPCVLPLVPGYLSYVSGVSGSNAAGETSRDEDSPLARRAAGRPGWGGGLKVGRWRARVGPWRVRSGFSMGDVGS